MDVRGFYLLESKAMAGIGKGERKNLGLENHADEPSRKSTRRGIYGHELATFPSRPSENSAATNDTSSGPPPVAKSPSQPSSKSDTNNAIVETAPAFLQDEVISEPAQFEPSRPSTPVPPETRLRGCASCTETLEVDAFSSLATCKHERDICRERLGGWVSVQLRTLAWDQLTCPSSECASRLTPEDLQTHLTADVFERSVGGGAEHLHVLMYDRWNCRAFQAALEGVPGYFSCHSADCDYGHTHDDEGTQNNIWRCQNLGCNARICALHKMPFHDGETCTQYDERKASEKRHKEEEAASEATVVQISKLCPGESCGYHVEKISGCDHMTCGCSYDVDVNDSDSRFQAGNASIIGAGYVSLHTMGLRTS